MDVSLRGDSGRVRAIVGEHSVTPYPLCRAMPNKLSIPALVAGSRGAPEEVRMRSAENLRDEIFLSLAYCRIWLKMAGVPYSNVMHSFSSITRAVMGSKRGIR